MKRAMNVYEEELPEITGKLLSVNAILPKELKNYLLKLLKERVEEKGEKKVVEELFETNYGKEWEKEVGRRLEVIKILLSAQLSTQDAEEKPEEAKAEKAEKAERRVKSIADKFRNLG